MPWVTRGLRSGVVTTRYPRRPDGYPGPWVGSVRPRTSPPGEVDSGLDLESLCPTGAIRWEDPVVTVDRGRCILCMRCVRERPDIFVADGEVEVAVLHPSALVSPGPGSDDERALATLRTDLLRRTRALRRSVHIRHVDAGSDGTEEWEIAALTNPVYDVQRLGIFFTASPRHADILLVTGAGSGAMTGPLVETYEAMPSPKVVVAAGTDALSGGMHAGSYATTGGVTASLPVDVLVPGSPPSPFSLLHGILLAVGIVADRSGGGKQHEG